MSDFAVLHLCSWYPTPYRPEHGIFHQSHIRSASLLSRQVVVYVAFNERIGQTQKIINHEKNLHEYITILPKRSGYYFKIIKFFLWVNAYKKLLSDVKKKYPDIRLVHLHVVLPVGIIFLLFGKVRKCPLIISEQWSGYFAEDGNYKGFLKKTITKLVFQKSRKVLTGSDKLGKRLIELGLTKNYIFMENALPEYFFQRPSVVFKKNSIIHFLHVSSLTEREKNISGMLNAFLKLKNFGAYDFKLTVVGGDSEVVQKYRNWVNANGLQEHVIFVGKVLNHELPAYYEKADVLVLFSYFESQPVVVLEAWAMGVPVLCTPVGQLPKWMKPEFGACAKSGKEEDLLELLLKAPHIIKHSDANEMKRFLKENFSEEVVGNKLNEIYKDVISEFSSL